MTVATVGTTAPVELFRGTPQYPAYSAYPAYPTVDGTVAAVGRGDLDFCSPCNPYFPTSGMFASLAVRLRDILTSRPSPPAKVTSDLASLLGLPPQTLVMGNGSTELITWIDHLLIHDSLAVPVPDLGRWTDQPMATGKRVDMFQLQEAAGFALDPTAFVSFVRARGSRAAVICNPNDPDGNLLPRDAVLSLIDSLADLDLLVIDETFLDFADAEPRTSVMDQAVLRHNVIVLRGLGRNLGLHGAPSSYLAANPALAGKIRSMLPQWNLSSFAEIAVLMLRKHGQEYAQSLRMLIRDRQDMTAQLTALRGLTVFPSQGNFVFVKLPDGVDGVQVRDRLLAEHSLLVRECGDKLGSTSQFMRMVVRPQPDVDRLVAGLDSVMYGSRWYAPQPAQEYSIAYTSPFAEPPQAMYELSPAWLQQPPAPALPPPQLDPQPVFAPPGAADPALDPASTARLPAVRTPEPAGNPEALSREPASPPSGNDGLLTIFPAPTG